jgi:ABC-2 type transport system ATP-binding protein
MRMIVNILYPDRGAVRVFGEEMRGTRAEISYLPEERGLYRKMAVRPMLEFYGELRGGRKASAEVGGWLERLELSHCANRKVRNAQQGHEPESAVHRRRGAGA